MTYHILEVGDIVKFGGRQGGTSIVGRCWHGTALPVAPCKSKDIHDIRSIKLETIDSILYKKIIIRLLD